MKLRGILSRLLGIAFLWVGFAKVINLNVFVGAITTWLPNSLLPFATILVPSAEIVLGNSLLWRPASKPLFTVAGVVSIAFLIAHGIILLSPLPMSSCGCLAGVVSNDSENQSIISIIVAVCMVALSLIGCISCKSSPVDAPR